MNIKSIVCFVVLLGISFTAVANEYRADDNVEIESVEYVKICSLLGKGYLVVPGQDGPGTYTCLDPNTGIGAVVFQDNSFSYNQSQLLRRIAALEAQLRMTQAQFGIYPSDDEEIE